MVRADCYPIAIWKTILDIPANEPDRTWLVAEAHLREQAAFHAGIKHAISMAQLAALTIELRPDAGHVRQRAAIEALRGLAEGLKEQGRATVLPVVRSETIADAISHHGHSNS